MRGRVEMRMRRITLLQLFLLPCLALSLYAAAAQGQIKKNSPNLRAAHFSNSSVEIMADQQSHTLHTGERIGDWTLMEVISDPGQSSYAVLEDWAHPNGHVIFVDTRGVRIDLPKSSEPTSADPSTLLGGHTPEEITRSAPDLLGNEILAKPGDPEYEEVARVFPPIRKIKTYSFVGTPDNPDKVGFVYGGRTPDFDPAPYYQPINKIRDEGKVLDGLVGGYLPILRFVYPESEGNWTEMIAFAPLRISNDNDRIQPVWYRVVRVEGGVFKWARYIDSYHPFPPRTDYDPKIFYRDLVNLNDGWMKHARAGDED